MAENLISEDPFSSVDQKGVGFLIQRAVESGRTKKPELKLGICGEHGAEQESIYFFNKLGLNYVSCSAYRVPVARLIAARSAVKKSEGD
jgi:pyruvate,orthophosphate dikinase